MSLLTLATLCFEKQPCKKRTAYFLGGTESRKREELDFACVGEFFTQQNPYVILFYRASITRDLIAPKTVSAVLRKKKAVCEC